MAPPSPLTTPFIFLRGEYAVYDNWKLDVGGYTIASSHFRETWTVVDTASRRSGRFPVSVIIDSVFSGTIPLPGSLSRIDTLLFYTSPSGDLYQYGFLSSLFRRRTGASLKPQWDLLAAFSQGTSGFWTVGASDTADSVYGSFNSTKDFVAIGLNGVQTVFQTTNAELFGTDLDVTLLFTDSPAAFVEVRDESNESVLGMTKVVSALFTGTR